MSSSWQIFWAEMVHITTDGEGGIIGAAPPRRDIVGSNGPVEAEKVRYPI